MFTGIQPDDPLYDRLDKDTDLPPGTTELDRVVRAYLKQHSAFLAQLQEIGGRWDDRQPLAHGLLVELQQRVIEGRETFEALYEGLWREALEAKAIVDAQRAEEQAQRDNHQILRDAMIKVGDPKGQSNLVGELDLRDLGQGCLPFGVNVSGGETIVVVGDKGSGKSSTSQVLVEAMTDPDLPSPACSVTFTYNDTDQQNAELLTALLANDDPEAVEQLTGRYQMTPRGQRRIVYFAPEELIKKRRLEFPKERFPNLIMRPLKVRREEVGLTTFHRFLGAELSNHSMYLRQMAKGFQSGLSMEAIIASVGRRAQGLAEGRLGLLGDMLWDGPAFGDALQPGTAVVVELSGVHAPPGDVVPIIAGLTDIIMRQRLPGDRDFHKVILCEESHLYLNGTQVGAQMVTLSRLIRHLLGTLVVVTLDPSSIPAELIPQCGLLFLHRCTSPSFLQQVKQGSLALKHYRPEAFSLLEPGEFVLLAKASSAPQLMHQGRRGRMRRTRSKTSGDTRLII